MNMRRVSVELFPPEENMVAIYEHVGSGAHRQDDLLSGRRSCEQPEDVPPGAFARYTRLPAVVTETWRNGGVCSGSSTSMPNCRACFLIALIATVAGWDSHPPGKRAFPRRTEICRQCAERIRH